MGRAQRLLGHRRWTRSERAEEAKNLGGKVVIAVGETFNLYRDLTPDGRPLSAAERERVDQRLDANAQLLRTVTQQRGLLEEAAAHGWEFLGFVDLLRTMQRSLILICSSDALRRLRAMPWQHVGGLVRAHWEIFAPRHNLPSWEELPAARQRLKAERSGPDGS